MFYFWKVMQPYAHFIQLKQLIFNFQDDVKFFIFVVFISENLFLKHK